MEDKLMKCTNLTILIGSFLLLFSLSSAGEKAVINDHFLSINPNIKNEKLHAELVILRTDFDAERQKIQDYYTEEIEKLKEERLSEVQTIKNKFGEKREIILKKYGEERSPKGLKPDQLNQLDKKPIRKPK